jgi:radical SAM/Cys-rich protein
MVEAFKDRLKRVSPRYIRFDTLQTLQVNLGNLCNMHCEHCHIGASPAGKNVMEAAVIDKIVEILACRPDLTLDITGGCPEMHPHFRQLLTATAGLPSRRIVRSNLTILTEPGYEWLSEFFRMQRLVVTASLPCYLEENADSQRGEGTHVRSIAALGRLNELGYGDELELNLVYNPGGDFIPGSQQVLEDAYRKELGDRYGIRFNHLFTITNAPIGRFREYLESRGIYDRYMNLLATRFNPDAASGIMCRTLISVDWEGVLYNCDCNQAIGMPITDRDGKIMKLEDLERAAVSGKELLLSDHCYCCTAGEGSSCTGALVA